MILKAHPLFEKEVKKLDKRDKERLLDALHVVLIIFSGSQPLENES